MKAYRYNAKQRGDRKFNTTGSEKNPNGLKYYSTNMDYVEAYRYVYYEDGDINYECDLEIVEINGVNLFNMAALYHTTKAYEFYINSEIGAMLKDYSRFLLESTKKSEIKKWQSQIDSLKNREVELVKNMIANEFQCLSDYEVQNILVAELKANGYDGYHTANEIVVF